MSPNLLSPLLAAAILIHAVLGCCWHHAHRDACAPVAPGQASERHVCGSHRQGHDPHDGGNFASAAEFRTTQHDSDEQPAPCDEPDCTYLSVAAARFAAEALVNPGWPAPVPVAATSGAGVPTLALDLPRALTDPAALRAALQVWLI